MKETAMTPRNGIPGYAMGDATVGAPTRGSRPIQLTGVPFSRRMWARLFAARYDQQIEDGVTVAAGTSLAAHYLRLTSRGERDDMAHALTLLLWDAGSPRSDRDPAMRVPIRTEAVQQSGDVVQDVMARLLGPLPVRARGVARLRILLSDGRSPVYRSGAGTFAAAMRGVLAAM
jgi:hypothetical protein